MYERINKEVPPAPDLPDEICHILEAFWSLNNSRSSNGFSLNPVQWTELEAWQRGTGNLLTNDETKIIMSLFSVFDAAMADIQPKDT